MTLLWLRIRAERAFSHLCAFLNNPPPPPPTTPHIHPLLTKNPWALTLRWGVGALLAQELFTHYVLIRFCSISGEGGRALPCPHTHTQPNLTPSSSTVTTHPALACLISNNLTSATVVNYCPGPKTNLHRSNCLKLLSLFRCNMSRSTYGLLGKHFLKE